MKQPPPGSDGMGDTLRLVARVRSEEPDAWTDLHGRIAPWLLGQLHHERFPPHMDAHDLVQEVMAEACRTIERFLLDGDSSFKAWILSIARMRLIDALRRESVRGGGKVKSLGARPGEGDVPEPAEDGASVTRQVRSSEFRGAFKQAMEQLSSKQRKILELRLFQELPYDQVADLMGMRTEENARSYFLRTRKALQSLLTEHA